MTRPMLYHVYAQRLPTEYDGMQYGVQCYKPRLDLLGTIEARTSLEALELAKRATPLPVIDLARH